MHLSGRELTPVALLVMIAAPSGPILTPAPRAWSFSTQLPSLTLPRVTLGGVGTSTLMLLSRQTGFSMVALHDMPAGRDHS